MFLKQKNITRTRLKALIAYNHRDKHLNRQVATLLFLKFSRSSHGNPLSRVCVEASFLILANIKNCPRIIDKKNPSFLWIKSIFKKGAQILLSRIWPRGTRHTQITNQKPFHVKILGHHYSNTESPGIVHWGIWATHRKKHQLWGGILIIFIQRKRCTSKPVSASCNEGIAVFGFAFPMNPD